jgi:hypothetical protein
MSRMAIAPAQSNLPGGRSSTRSAVAWVVTAVAGSALLSLLGGLLWGELAPRALLQQISPGTAQLVNAETRAFITADAWFCGIAVLAGLLTGILGYRFGVAPRSGGRRAAVAAALIAGAVLGAFAMQWLGGQIGLATYNNNLSSSPAGTLFPASLALGAKSALAFWPMFTAIVLVVAEWSARPAAHEYLPAGQEPSGPAGQEPNG